LDLAENKIQETGIKYLSDALQQNTVRWEY